MSQALDLRYSLKSLEGVYHLHGGTTQSMIVENTVKGMHACISIANKLNVLMMSIMMSYNLKSLYIELDCPETVHYFRRLVILKGAYFVTNFGYLLLGNEILWVDVDCIYKHIEVGKTDVCAPHLLVRLLGRFKKEDEY